MKLWTYKRGTQYVYFLHDSLFQTIGNAAWSSALYSVIVDHLKCILPLSKFLKSPCPKYLFIDRKWIGFGAMTTFLRNKL